MVVIKARVKHLIGAMVASVGLALMVSAQPSITFPSESELRRRDALELRDEARNACEHLVFVAALLSRAEHLGAAQDVRRLAAELEELRRYLSRIGAVALGADRQEYARWYARLMQAQTWVECEQRVVRY
jgi:ATP-dependent protease ClpP protease subunit